jgi:hypothetical protein
METSELLRAWVDAKMDRPIWKLVASAEVEHTLRRATCGPSSYAFVQFRCEPWDSLAFESSADWPAQLAAEEIARVERAVGIGVVDAFATLDIMISKVCKVTLASTGWDDVGSSEYAFYLATKHALSSFVAEPANWTLSLR